ncbi:flagellar biosynthetic protein FliO [Oceanobacillus alkalisoli]|uniref:flagellar biosynthetic protein FliO n=1 Tax=Oceanobacillus alkalisoli TaxID=2925113 RepID=UPI001EEF8123|nr:flagellar biosynthetic protein FliO [Oceanobacillus alkalisoli]MCF3942421.1 flagellar biosynthetic protein FliO [Oceanobacillus alkalisoli]MCG5103478.1 flagellar biosynthetic protein FliO [Oceanobacillus alkalisoli]
MESIVRYVIFVPVVLFILFGNVNVSLAAPGYVDECLENPEHCEESLTEEDNGGNPELLQQEEPESLFFQIVRLVFALLLVVGLIYVFLYFLKRRNKFGNRIKNLENVGGISVGQNKTVQLIRLGDKLYLIGVAENITLLEEIEDPILMENIMKAKEEQTELDASNIFSSILKKNRKEEEKESQFNQLFNQELNRLQRNRKSIIDKHKEDRNE